MSPATRRFAIAIAAIALVGLMLRLFYALVVVGDAPLLGDGLEFQLLGRELADGHGYVQAFALRDSGLALPTASKPPLYPLVLAGPALLGLHGYVVQHIVTALLGCATIVVCGLLGRRIGGETTGIVAAALAATYPMLVVTDGSLRSETLYALLVGLALLAALRLQANPTRTRGAILGLVCALSALTRTEGALLLVLLLVVALWPHRHSWRRALPSAAVSLLVAALAIAPWTIRNWIEFDRLVPIATNAGGVVAGANCPQTYAGDLLGHWDYACLATRPDRNEAVVSERLRRRGTDYARDHVDRLPLVALARIGRTWDLYRPRQQAYFASFYEGRDLRWEQVGIAVYYLLLVLAAVGVWLLRRRRAALAVLLVPPVLVTLTAVTAYGWTRFRIAAELSIVVLASYALVTLARAQAARRRRAPAASPPAPGRTG